MSGVRAGTFATPLIVLVNAFLISWIVYTWSFSYFWVDDFNNLYWARSQSGTQMLRHVVDPFSEFFRPVGMLFYWIGWNLFGLNPLPYHVLAGGLHALNVLLLCVFLRRTVGGVYSAGLGGVLFAYRANFTDIYWSFATIYELLACLFVLTALLVHGSGTSYHGRLILTGILYVSAVKSKEIAIVLPAILLLYDLCLRGRRVDGRMLGRYSILGLIGIWFTWLKWSTMGSRSPEHPYYMDFTPSTLLNGYGWYFDRLLGFAWPWNLWLLLSALLVLLTLRKGEHRGIFFLGCVYLTLLPVVFLVNHRFEFYWYLPFLGVSGLAALAGRSLGGVFLKRLPARTAAILAAGLFLVFSGLHFVRETRSGDDARRWQEGVSREYRAFVESLLELERPREGDSVHFRSIPSHLTPDVLRSAVIVAFDRNLEVAVVNEFPEPCRHCLEFDPATLKVRRIEK